MSVIHDTSLEINYSRCHENTPILNSSLLDTAPDPSLWRLVLRQEMEERYLRIPAITMLALLMAVGVLGNILVLVVYKRSFGPSTTRVFLMSLAAFDLLNCAVGIPFEIKELTDDITENIPRACKIFRFIIVAAISGSVSVLVFVSIDRYRRACRPLQSQMTTRQAHCLVVTACIIALAMSIPVLFFYGVKTEYRHGILVYDCLIDNSWETSKLVFGYQALQLVLSVVCILILTVLYTCIIYAIRKQQSRRRAMSAASLSSQAADKKTVHTNENMKKARSWGGITGHDINKESRDSESKTCATQNVIDSTVISKTCATQNVHNGHKLLTERFENSSQHQGGDAKGTNGGGMETMQEISDQQPHGEAANNNCLVGLISTDSSKEKKERSKSPMSCRPTVPTIIIQNVGIKHEIGDETGVFMDPSTPYLPNDSVFQSNEEEISSEQSNLNKNSWTFYNTEKYLNIRGDLQPKMRDNLQNGSQRQVDSRKLCSAVNYETVTFTMGSDELINIKTTVDKDTEYHSSLSGDKDTTHHTSSLSGVTSLAKGQGRSIDGPFVTRSCSSLSLDDECFLERGFDGFPYHNSSGQTRSCITRAITLDALNNAESWETEFLCSVDILKSVKRTRTVSWNTGLTENSHRVDSIQNNNGPACESTFQTSSKSDKDSEPMPKQTAASSEKSMTSSGKGDREIKISTLTTMMLFVSIAFFLSYLPHLGVQIYRGLYQESVRHTLCTSKAYYVFHHIFLRSYFINNAINPIIYTVFNMAFRLKAKELLSSLLAKLVSFMPDKSGSSFENGGDENNDDKDFTSDMCCGRCLTWTLVDDVYTSTWYDRSSSNC